MSLITPRCGAGRYVRKSGSRDAYDHLPLYRQAAILEREAGLEIGRATLDGWVMRVGELLQPVVSAVRQDLLRASYLQADETIVPVQMHDKRGADHQAYLWQYGKPGGETDYLFRAVIPLDRYGVINV